MEEAHNIEAEPCVTTPETLLCIRQVQLWLKEKPIRVILNFDHAKCPQPKIAQTQKKEPS